MGADGVKEAIQGGAKEVELRVGSTSLALVRIPPGEFDMGSPPTEPGHHPSEAPVRRVKITKPFYLGRYEVTQAQYLALMKENPSEFRGDTLAMDQVKYETALEFCKRLSGLAGVEVTLPTEAQWEYACRAGTRTRFYCGETATDLGKAAWYRENSGARVHPVGQKQPNAWGLYDMLGNLCEICLDDLGPYEWVKDTDPRGEVRGGGGTVRGGGWMHPEDYCRCATRVPYSEMFGGMGLRIAINP
jgi:formylglycine-generating enzyme required for sulfatase activity